MVLSLAKLEAVSWVHRLGSFQAAAGQLNVTQPTISLRVRELEDQLGILIFRRSGHKISLTEKGTELLVYADRLMGIADEMQNRIGNRPTFRGVLRLGAADSFALTCLPGLLRRLEQAYPEMQVELYVDHSVNLSRKLNGRELDMAFLVDPQVEDHVKIESVCTIRLIWMAGVNQKLPKGILRPQHLQFEQILTLPSPSTSYSIIENWFARADLRPTRVSTCNSMNMIVSLALKNCGISIVPMCIVLQELRAGLVKKINVSPELPSHSLFVAYQARHFKARLREIAGMGMDEVAQHEAFQQAR